MPTKLKYKMLVSFCLMSLLPILAGVYVASTFVKFPFDTQQNNLTAGSFVILFSLVLSFLGLYVTKQMMMPIKGVSEAAHHIAEGRLDEDLPAVADSTDELQDLSRSLKLISKNAKELLDKVEKLSLKDKLTGLYNATYIRERLDEEIQRAIHYQRPCAFAYILMGNYDAYAMAHGEKGAEEAMKAVADVFNNHMREFDRAARIGRGEFVIIFPDKNKKKCIEIIEAIGLDISLLPLIKEGGERMLPRVGISENPIDGVHADGLYLKAQDRMKMAWQNGKLLEAFA